jgi:predicted secreted hydrolase
MFFHLGRIVSRYGVVWMDHQWGNFLTLGGGGWDWFSIQLDNDTEMMLYLIRDATGKTISTYVEYVGPQADVHLLRLILLPKKYLSGCVSTHSAKA